jgi:UDP-N-acetylglucosamine 2-epimerase (non-hydrolysing)
MFAPTTVAESNLKTENVWGDIRVTGNTVIDAVVQHLPIAERKSTILESIDFERFILATAHRAENVDDVNVLKSLMRAFAEAPMPVVYPMHPRTRKRLRQNNVLKEVMEHRNVQILPPLGYLDFLVLMKKCDAIVTDSGGVQEEATAPNIRKPVLVTRLSTERPEAVKTGFSEVVGVDKNKILEAMNPTVENPKELPEKSLYGDGAAAEQIIEIIKQEFLF